MCEGFRIAPVGAAGLILFDEAEDSHGLLKACCHLGHHGTLGDE